MAQAGDSLRLDPETLELLGPDMGIAADHLERDEAVRARLKGLVHDPHAPLTELPADLVAGDQGTCGRTGGSRPVKIMREERCGWFSVVRYPVDLGIDLTGMLGIGACRAVPFIDSRIRVVLPRVRKKIK